MSGQGIAQLEELSDVPGDDQSMEYLQGLEDGMLLARETIIAMSCLKDLSEDQWNQVRLMFEHMTHSVQMKRMALLRPYIG